MLSRLHSMALAGIEALRCEVEVDVASRGFANAAIVGLPDTAVKESLERVRSALRNSGYDWPKYKTVINLAPADIKKEGPAFDLPIALGMVFAGGEGTPDRAAEYLIAGELALDGRVRPIKGALSMALLAKEKGLHGLILPRDNAPEAAVCEDVEVIGIGTLAEAVGFLLDRLPLEPTCIDINEVFGQASQYDIDFAEVRGQESAKRALTIAAAGAHNVLTLGASARDRANQCSHRALWLESRNSHRLTQAILAELVNKKRLQDHRAVGSRRPSGVGASDQCACIVRSRGNELSEGRTPGFEANRQQSYRVFSVSSSFVTRWRRI